MKRKSILRKLETILFLTMLTGCNTTGELDEAKKAGVAYAQQMQTETDKTKTTPIEPLSLNIHEEISSVPAYQTVFAFEKLSSGISTVPLDKVKAMYEEMKATFDYILVSDYPLAFRGDYQGDTNFVDGYEQYQADGMPNPVNVVARDWAGNEFLTTPLKTILLGEDMMGRFDNSIAEGRNLQMSDFTLAAPDEPIHVALGHAYKEMYKVGDTFSLELVSEVMNFQVVGFYQEGTGFAMQQPVDFDYTIVMPHILLDYEPVGEAAIFQHAFHLAELTSGYIQIENINEDTYNHMVSMVEEMAQRHGLSGLYKMANEPVEFVW